MCDLCEGAAARLALSAAEEAVILAEIEDGSSAAPASRPLSPAEREAGTLFGDIQKLHITSLDEARRVLAQLNITITSAILDALFPDLEEIDAEDVVRGLSALNAEQPKPVRAAVVTASEKLRILLTGVYALSSGVALREAVKAGARAAVGRGPLDAPRSMFSPYAASAALYPWTRITSKLQTDLLSPGALASGRLSRSALAARIADIPLDGAVDVARQAINQAQNAGRIDTAETLEPLKIWASELLDEATCDPCAKIDGKRYKDLAEAREDYPFGGYFRCDGDARCRGTLVFVYPKGGAAPAEAPAPRP